MATQRHCPRCAKLGVRRAGEQEIWDCPDHGVIYKGPAPEQAAVPASTAEAAKPAAGSIPAAGTPRRLNAGTETKPPEAETKPPLSETKAAPTGTPRRLG